MSSASSRSSPARSRPTSTSTASEGRPRSTTPFEMAVDECHCLLNRPTITRNEPSMLFVTRRPALAAALFLSAVLASSRQATACDCIGVPTAEYLRGADVVYTGRVVDIRTDSRRFGWPEIEFKLEHTIKGRTDGERVVLMTPAVKGVNCRGFDFAVGKAYLVFATTRDSETGRAGTYGVSWCGGTVLLESDEGN